MLGMYKKEKKRVVEIKMLCEHREVDICSVINSEFVAYKK